MGELTCLIREYKVPKDCFGNLSRPIIAMLAQEERKMMYEMEAMMAKGEGMCVIKE